MTLRNLSFQPTKRTVVLTGEAAPGTKVTAENLSAAPFSPSTNKDTFASTTADAHGRFKLSVPLASEGDKVRVTEAGQPASSTILGVRLMQAGVQDGRRAEVGHQGLRLVEDGQGAFGFANVRKNKVLGEPGADFELRNTRSGEVFSFKLNDQGMLPQDARVKGQPGDELKLHVGDGAHLDWMGAEGWGSFIIPGSAQPPATADILKQGPVTTAAFKGPLFVDGVDARDACQGQVGDCYMVSTAAAIANTRPEALKNLFKENADGTITVTFQGFDDAAKAYRPVPITVTRDMPVHWGQPIYGADDGSKDAGSMETWFAVLEKAYAQWKGGYDAITCGYPYEMFEAMLGNEGKHLDTRGLTPDALWKALKSAADNKQPALCWTGGEAPGRAFTNTGLYGDHAYTVMGAEERSGVKGVMLRNPWGQSEPGNDGRNDGIFWLPLKQFQQFYVGVGIAD